MDMRQRSGITILELLIVVAIIGILTTVGVVMFKPNHAMLAAQEFQAMMRQARFEAVRLTRPVEVEWGTRDSSSYIEAYILEPRTATGTFNINQQPLCEKDRVEDDAPITTDFRVKQDFNNTGNVKFKDEGSVYWLPNGLAFGCETKLPVTNLSLEIIDSRSGNEVGLKFVGSFDVEVVTE